MDIVDELEKLIRVRGRMHPLTLYLNLNSGLMRFARFYLLVKATQELFPKR